MKSELKGRLARLGPIRGVDRVTSGSSADIVIRPESSLSKVKTIDAVHALVRRGASAKAAKTAVETMVEHGEAVIELPTVERGPGLAEELQSAGIQAMRIVRPKTADVKAIRQSLGLSVVAFGKRFGINPRTIEGWEQGRPIDETANAYLHAIAANPAEIGRVLEEPVG